MTAKISLVISSKGSPARLDACLKHLDFSGLAAKGGEIVLVHTEGDADTAEVMKAFAASAPVPTKVVSAARKGLSAARNEGVKASSGALILFTDDDCLMQPGYVACVAKAMASGDYGYGSGRTVTIYGDNEHINTKHCPERRELPPGEIPPSGTVQGSNMFFRREVFDRLGLFHEDMGAGCGTLFSWEDGEMVARACLAGFTGIMLPEAVIEHRQPKPWSPEMNEKHHGYEHGRGAYHAHLLALGRQEAWKLWALDWRDRTGPLDRRDLERLEREFRAAADYVRWVLDGKAE